MEQSEKVKGEVLLARFINVPIDEMMPANIAELWPCWVKFREIDFHDFSKNYEYTTYHKRIVGAFAIGDIPDIFAALVAGVEWYNSIKEEGK